MNKHKDGEHTYWKATRSHSLAVIRPGPAASLSHGLIASLNKLPLKPWSWYTMNSMWSTSEGHVGSALAATAASESRPA